MAAIEPANIGMIEKSTNQVYPEFITKSKIVEKWAEDKHVFQTLWRGKPSKNSFSLKKPNTYRSALPEILIDRFGIKDKDRFVLKYKEAISGDGQEWTRITTLHSSSLAALLCFYNVSGSNPLKMGEYTFTESFFEVKTHVFGESESNMDVVLRGKDEYGMKVVLFLECKFSEYLNYGKYDGISKDYFKVYKNLGLFENKEHFKVDGEKADCICISPVTKHLYCAGIKQMISHYIGVSNYADKCGDALAEHSSFKADKEEKVLLGEMLFDFKDSITNASDKLNNYRKAYKHLSEIMNKKRNIMNKKRNVMILDIFTYQDIFERQNKSFIKEEIIRGFYHFE